VEVPNEVGELSQRVGSDRGFSAGEPSGGGAPGYPVGGDSGRRTTHFVGGGVHIRLEVRSLQRGRCRRREKRTNRYDSGSCSIMYFGGRAKRSRKSG
jgi:hypothetical protein